ncbi:MAG: M1 family metallopeptidase [Terriglobales bacterium]
MTFRLRGALRCAALFLLAAAPAAQEASPPSPAALLYRQFGNARLDPQRVHTVRDARLDREDLHISLSDGTLAFTESVDGRITGAFFEGEGEILLAPPNQVERASLARFTGAAILSEKFSTAYFRFNDDTYEKLLPDLRPKSAAPAPPEDAEPQESETPAQFVERWNPAARTLAAADALRLLASFTAAQPGSDRILHARLSGEHLGTFDVFFDTALNEQISVGQMSYQEGTRFYDVWTAFPMRSRRAPEGEAPEPLRISAYRIRARILPSHELEAEAQLTMQAGGDGRRLFIFELSRYLRVTSVSADGQPVEVLQNESLEGSELARRGNDVVAVVLPRPPAAGQTFTLRFVYSGEVLSEAGGGLMYVGARGAWYPNLGPAMAEFDLEFRYPSAWILLATGKRLSLDTVAGEQVAHWVSERPIPLAGFNLGRYVASSAKAGDVLVETYATHAMETAFPRRKTVVVPPPSPRGRESLPLEVTLPPPDPAANAHQVAERAARTIEFLSKRIAPFPYGSLSISQMPGRRSQGWPGLVFLSSFAFLPASDPSRPAGDSFDAILYGQLMQAHETAHQWWGDSVLWKSYRDQWVMEGLANYCALLALESERPADFRTVMQRYRQDLLHKSKGDSLMKDAGPVTGGARLASSRFPDGYNVVTYARGTWLFHMLRHMLRDAVAAPPAARARAARTSEGDTLFFQVLATLHQRFQGRELSTADVQRAFEEALPPPLHYENRASLDWFFSGWVDGTALPRLELKDVRFARHGGKFVVTGTLVQKEAPDLLVTSVPIYAVGGGGKPVLLGRVFADGPESPFQLPAPLGATKLHLDPYQTVLTRP